MRPPLPTPDEVQRILAELRKKGMPTFEIRTDAKAVGGQAITCHICHLTSYHPKDVENRYCGHCHVFHEDP